MIAHDRLFKELLITFFSEFIELFFPELSDDLDRTSLDFLDKEVFTDVTAGETHEVDLVVKAKIRSNESFILVHLEAQSQHQQAFGKRMFRYFARLHEHHDLPVYPIVVFAFDRPKVQQPCVYTVRLPDLNVLTFRYRVIQLNRLHWRTFLKQENPVSAALMARMNFSKSERASVKLECLRMIATLRMDPARSRLISGFVDSYLKLTESEQKELDAKVKLLERHQREEVMDIVTSWMQDGIEQGLKQGLKQGREEGRKEGRKEGRFEATIATIGRQLTRRFGTVDESKLLRLRSLPLEVIEQLAEELLDFSSTADLDQWLSKNS